MSNLFFVLKKLIWNFTVLNYFFKKERNNRDKKVTISEKVWLWRNGFNGFHKRMYRLTKENINQFIGSYHYKKYHRNYNGLFHDVIDNKALLSFILPDELTCDLCLIFEKGMFMGSNIPIKGSVEKFIYKELEQRELICKPVFSSLGMGIVKLNKENVKRALGYYRLKKRSFIITEKVENMPYAKQIFPDAGNTIRLNLLRDPDSGKLILLFAQHNFGTSKSAPVDHTLNGGIETIIDPETGVFYKTRMKVNGKLRFVSEHPDTGKLIDGIKIPNWNSSLQHLLDLLNKEVWLRYAGIDAILTETGFKIIELNSLPFIEDIQEEFPLLSQPVARKFFKEAGHKIRDLKVETN
jgi:hypothetical protein